MSRFIVVAPGPSEAAALATDKLARVLGVATVDAPVGTTATDAALHPASVLSAAVEAVRAVGDGVPITPAREASNHTFDHVAWNLGLATSTRAGIIFAFDTKGVSVKLLAEEVTVARLRAKVTAAFVVTVILTGGAPAVEADVPVLNLPLGGKAAAALRATVAPTAVIPLAFQANLIEHARAERKRIVLPELDDDRVLQTAAQVLAAGIADTTFVDDADYVVKRVGKLGLDLSTAQVTSVNDPTYLECYTEEFARLRAKKGAALEQTREKVTDVSCFGTMIVHMGDADDMVLGVAHTTTHTIVPSFQIIKTAPSVSVVSSTFLMAMEDRVWTFSDCAVNPDPTAEQLVGIAVTFARAATRFDVASRVAMLSYSTDISGSGPDVDIVVEATRLARERAPELTIGGPIQSDAAADAAVAATKLPSSGAADKTIIFVFPSLETGNIDYKTVQRSSSAVVVSPILQGPSRPISDLSRDALVEDIVSTIALTAVQAQG